MIFKIDSTIYGYTDNMRCVPDKNVKYPMGYKILYEPVIFIFDPDTYIICEKGTDEADAVAEPMIFPSVTRLEAQKAYIRSLDDKKLNRIFSDLDDKEYFDTFWNVFDDGGEKLVSFEKFERRYRLRKITDWCDENIIPYYIDQKDDFIRRILE